MNITELARILKITPQELRDNLPKLGFDIGQRAIKIDTRTAQRIIKEWPRLKRQLEAEKKIEVEEEMKKDAIENKKEIFIPKYIAVREFSALAQIPVNKILAELMKNGVFASMNEKIDFETAEVIGSYLGIEIKLKEENAEQNELKQINKLEDILKKEGANLQKRPPVIVVMGHVDHGKTKLLDSIRKTSIMEGEAGGITQHIGAYQVTRKNKLISFIDTPGHEAFTAMRSRGAKIADVAILVVAADDGVKPQTIEAYRIIEAAKLPFVVAINKIDKPEADINKTLQELSTKLGIVPEDWGGKISCVPVSAKEGTGIDQILDTILFVAEIEEEKIKANPNSSAIGTIIESRVDRNSGPIATLLIQNGTLRVGENLCFENKLYGKARALKNYLGEDIKEAGPSTPVKIIGLKVSPEVGDILNVGDGEKIKFKKFKNNSFSTAYDPGNSSSVKEGFKKFNVIIKSDVLGSAEAIEESLEKIGTDDVAVKIIHKGLGNITESDIAKAEASDAQILGFNVKIDTQIENSIREKEVNVKIFKIIYDLIKYVKEEMEKLIVPEIIRKELGKIKVLAIFRSETKSQIIGGKVLSGQIEADSEAEIIREGKIIGECKISKIRVGKQDVKTVESDQECGLQCEGSDKVEAGNLLNVFKKEIITKKL